VRRCWFEWGWKTALRTEGYDGRLVLVGEEAAQPYDRPPLSKQVLLGKCESQDIALTDEDLRAVLDAEWLLGTRATALDPASGALTLADGRSLHTDGVVIATGARARTLPGMPRLRGVHTLRTLDDARRLREDLSRPGRVVVVGGASDTRCPSSSPNRSRCYVSWDPKPPAS